MRARLYDAFARVDYLLTYALARFAQQVLGPRVAPADVLLAAAVVAAGTVAWPGGGALRRTAESTHKVAAVLFAQHLLGGLPRPGTGSLARIARDSAVALSAVALVPTLLQPLLAEEAAAQVASLVFFMFAENSAQLTRDPELDHVLPFFAGLVLWATQSRPQARGVERSLLHAAAMLATNVLVETMLGAADLSIAALVAVLLLFDGLTTSLALAASLRDYAVWRSASLALALLLARGAPLALVVIGAGVCAGAAHAAAGWLGARGDAAVGMALLVAGNAGLEGVRRTLLGTPPRLAWGVLLGVTNAVHLALRALAAA
jgi:hypothetical protein